MITILFFAGAKEAAMTPSRAFEFAGPGTLREVADRLERDIPMLRPILPFVRFAVNGKLAELSQSIADGDEIAVLPPVSGG